MENLGRVTMRSSIVALLAITMAVVMCCSQGNVLASNPIPTLSLCLTVGEMNDSCPRRRPTRVASSTAEARAGTPLVPRVQPPQCSVAAYAANTDFADAGGSGYLPACTAPEDHAGWYRVPIKVVKPPRDTSPSRSC